MYTDLQSCAFTNEIKAQSPKEYQDKAGTASELDTGENSDLTKENAAAAGPRNGAGIVYEAAQLRGDNTPNGAAHAIAEWTRALLSGLSRAERAAVAFAALTGLPLDDAEITAQAALGGAGAPLPLFLAPMDDARWWASWASRAERKAYALAAYEALSGTDQAAFLDHVTDRRAAA